MSSLAGGLAGGLLGDLTPDPAAVPALSLADGLLADLKQNRTVVELVCTHSPTSSAKGPPSQAGGLSLPSMDLSMEHCVKDLVPKAFNVPRASLLLQGHCCICRS